MIENEISSWFCIELGVKQGWVLYLFIKDILKYFVLWNTTKAMGEHRIKWEIKTLLDFAHAEDSSVQYVNASKINEFWRLWQLNAQEKTGKLILEYEISRLELE